MSLVGIIGRIACERCALAPCTVFTFYLQFIVSVVDNDDDDNNNTGVKLFQSLALVLM